MAESEYRFNGKQKQTDSGEPNKGFGDGAASFGRKNFSGPKSSKSGPGVAPHASGSPWKGDRQSQSEGKDYSKDYTRRGSQYGSGATGPKKPSDEIPGNIYGSSKSSRDSQKKHI